jgi:hypothetical protein
VLSDLSTLGRGVPDSRPVDTSLRTRCSTNDFKHNFSRIFIATELSGAISLEVFRQNMGVFANVAVVNSLSSLSEEQKVVELLEQDGGWLMDSAKNSLSIVGKLAKKSTDRPGSLGIKPRGWFVKEEKKSRFSGKLNTDSKTFALLNIES